MAECKDCIHFDVCSHCYIYEKVEGKNECECENFKEKSKVIELPCKVGDVVYIVDEYSDEVKGYDEGKVVSFYVDDKSMGLVVDIDEWQDFSFGEIGKTVFLTLEEAQKALVEKKNG